LQSQPLDRDPEILYTSVGRRQQFTSAQNRKEGRSVGPSDADYLPFEHPRSDEFYPFPLPSLFPLLRVIGLDNALGTITHSSLEIDTEMRASALSPSLLPSNLHYYSFLARIARIAYAESDAEFCNIMNFNEVYKPMRGTYFSGVAGAAGNFSRKQLFARHALSRARGSFTLHVTGIFIHVLRASLLRRSWLQNNKLQSPFLPPASRVPPRVPPWLRGAVPASPPHVPPRAGRRGRKKGKDFYEEGRGLYKKYQF